MLSNEEFLECYRDIMRLSLNKNDCLIILNEENDIYYRNPYLNRIELYNIKNKIENDEDSENIVGIKITFDAINDIEIVYNKK